MDELRYDLNAKRETERWQEDLESKGFKISHTKTEYMNCNLSEVVLRQKI